MKACLFDIDGVIIHENTFFIHRFSQQFDIPMERIRPFFRHDFLDCLRGRKDTKAVLERYVSNWKWQGTADDVLMFWLETEQIRNEKLLSYIHSLKSIGIETYIVSNQFKERADHLLNEVGLQQYFDGAFFSYQFGFLKDDPRFFKLMLEHLPHIDAREAVFWDNDIRFVTAAEKAGIRGHLYTTYDAFAESMYEIMKDKDIFVRRILGDIFPDDVVVASHLISEGIYAHVYEALMQHEGTVIVELYNDPSMGKVASIQQEVLTLARSRGIPVPELISSGESSDNAFMIFCKISGIPAIEFKGDKSGIWERVGRIARDINAIPAPAYGRLWFWKPSPQLWSTWREYVEDDIERLRGQAEAYSLTEDEKILICGVLEDVRAIAAWEFEPRIIHGDLYLKNFMVNGRGDIQAIIDWDELHYGRAPHHELASTLLWTTPKEAAAFLKGYGVSDSEWEILQPDVELLQQLKLAEYILFFAGRGDEARKEKLKRKLIGIAHRWT